MYQKNIVMNSASTMPDISRRAWHSRSINNVLVFSAAKVRLRQRCWYGQEHGNGEAEWVEHSECLQTSMGRLDPAKSGEEGGGTIEGEGTSFYFHQGQMLNIICPYIYIYSISSMRRSIFRSEAERILSRLPVSLFEFSRFSWRHSRASPETFRSCFM